MNKKALLLLALTLFTVVSTIATVAVASNVLVPNSFSMTKTIANATGSGDITPNGGDEVDNPVLPD